MQQLFAIEPYRADQPLEAWFGTLTLCLAVFINATMLSKILEIWTALNKRQTDLDNRLNSVMAFLRLGRIGGGVCVTKPSLEASAVLLCAADMYSSRVRVIVGDHRRDVIQHTCVLCRGDAVTPVSLPCRANGIVGDLRHDILDYFEFRYKLL